MICPTDKSAMVVVNYEGIELDYCAECCGVWFDSGELELLLGKMQLDDAILEGGSPLDLPEVETKEKKWRCPICGRRMKKVNVGNPPVLIDACGQGHGLWFDGGEVAQLAARCRQKPGGSPEGRVICFLGEVFKAGTQE